MYLSNERCTRGWQQWVSSFLPVVRYPQKKKNSYLCVPSWTATLLPLPPCLLNCSLREVHRKRPDRTLLGEPCRRPMERRVSTVAARQRRTVALHSAILCASACPATAATAIASAVAPCLFALTESPANNNNNDYNKTRIPAANEMAGGG